MSDPRHATIKTRRLSSGAEIRWREYRFDGHSVPAFTTYKNNLRSWALENWLIERAIDTTLINAKRKLLLEHSAYPLDEKGRRIKSPAVRRIKDILENDTPEADMGTAVHEAFDSWFSTGTIPPGPEGSEPFIEQAIDFAMTVNPRPLFLEPEVYNATLGYAGSADWMFEIDGALCLGDTKTGGVWHEAALQLAAYANSERMYPRHSPEPCRGECSCEWLPTPKFDRHLILNLKADSWELFEVNPEHTAAAWDVFRAAVAVHKFNKVPSKSLFLPVARSKEEAAA